GPPCAEGARAADLVPRVTSGDGGRAGRDRLDSEKACEVLGRDLAVAMHQHDHWFLPIILHYQRLDHRMLGHAELARGHDGAAALLELVGMVGERDTVLAEHADRRGDRISFLGHRSTARMVARVQLLQSLARDVRVDLGGRRIIKTQEELTEAESAWT